MGDRVYKVASSSDKNVKNLDFYPGETTEALESSEQRSNMISLGLEKDGWRDWTEAIHVGLSAGY